MNLQSVAMGLVSVLLALVIVMLSPILIVILLARATQPNPEWRRHDGRIRAEQDRMARQERDAMSDRPPEFLRTGC